MNRTFLVRPDAAPTREIQAHGYREAVANYWGADEWDVHSEGIRLIDEHYWTEYQVKGVPGRTHVRVEPGN